MNMKILDLTEQNLGKAPEWEAHPFSCKYCLYWEYPELSFDPAAGVSEGEFSKKLAWLRRVRKEWGSCGKLLFVGNEVVGYAQYAPTRFLPEAREYPGGPVSEDAVLIACLFIPKPKFRGQGLGGLLLEAILEELSARGSKQWRPLPAGEALRIHRAQWSSISDTDSLCSGMTQSSLSCGGTSSRIRR
jgi:hypothetical protein